MGSDPRHRPRSYAPRATIFVDTRLDGDSRLVTFANGAVIRERIVDVDDASFRLAYSVVDWRTTHHHASFQVFAEGESRSRIVWIADLLPDDLSDLVGTMMEHGCTAIKRTLESTVRPRLSSVES